MHDAGDDRTISPDQETIHRVLRFRHDFAANEQHHQHRHQGHRKQSRARHREGLGVGQGREQTSFLGFQRKDGQEGNGDDEQREEQCGADLFAGRNHCLDAIPVGMILRQTLDVLMGVFDHHDGRIDHRPDGDGDTAQAHQVRVHPQQSHGNEGNQHPDRQHQDGYQSTAHVHQEDDADQRDNETFFRQGARQSIDRTVNQFRTIIDRLDRHALRKPGRNLTNFFLQVVNDLQRVLAVARHGDTGNHFTFTIQLGETAPLVRRQFDTGNVTNQDGRPAL